MSRLAWMEGEWSGTAKVLGRGGERKLIQTEVIKPMLGGAVLLVEGRGFDDQGVLEFNAVATISYDPEADAYTMNAMSAGRATRPEISVLDDGFDWTIRQGPVVIEYRARYADGVWRESGTMSVPGQQPRKFIEMELRRLGDTQETK